MAIQSAEKISADFKVADINDAEFGRKEIAIAEKRKHNYFSKKVSK